MPTYLVVHTRYSDVEIGLFKANQFCASIKLENKLVSSCFPLDVTKFLDSYKITIHDLDFIAAHQGPAPFTTLRVSLAFLNGLAFTHKIPLIGIDGLRSFAIEQARDNYSYICVFLNAFCNDIYAGIYQSNNNNFQEHVGPAHKIIDYAAQVTSGSILCIGNGVLLHQELIRTYFGSRAIIPDFVPEIVSITSIAQQALTNWKKQEAPIYSLMPLYLKSAV
jgi:tRNA threonylcarbamoyladenosine biosynthesis protein TsaB